MTSQNRADSTESLEESWLQSPDPGKRMIACYGYSLLGHLLFTIPTVTILYKIMKYVQHM